MEAKHLEELVRRGKDRTSPLFSRFLNLDEQKKAQDAARAEGASYTLFGGAEDCERKVLGVAWDAPSGDAFPIECLLVRLRSQKFGEKLSHQAVLGTVMGLGLEREMIGDIVVRDEGAYLFCLRSVSALLSEGLTRVGRSDTYCAPAAPPEGPLREYREVTIQVLSPRVDAVCAHLYSLSRGDVQELIRQGRISVDDAECHKSDLPVRPGQVLSVRGYGRARFMAAEGLSRKGKMILRIACYT